jgi:myo-inositol-1(or 4)-monophosphatase
MRTNQELAQIALEVAREAGELIRAGYRSRPQVVEKSPADLQTSYDLDSERLIRRRLFERAPELGLVAEEEGGEQGSGPAWYVDPLDGTTNFAHGHPFWAVSIGVMDRGEPLVGAVVAPCLLTEWSGWLGGPALRNGELCQVSTTARLEEALLATGFPTDRTREPDSNLATFVRLKQKVRGIRRCGSAAIDLCLVADGTYDGYWERQLNAWDLAAGSAVVRCAGGCVSALDGSAPRLEIGHILATNGKLHPALLAQIEPRSE